MRLITIVGARPQFVKAAAVSRAIARQSLLEECIIHTGQHYDANMSDIFFEQMSIPRPHVFLDVHSGGHGAMTGRMLERLEKELMSLKPDAVLVYGDTNSTLAGALAAVKLHIPVVHAEAGLRSFNMLMPEEVNRILTDRVSSLLFCPTDTAVKNLEAEGFRNYPCEIVTSGDVMYDAALFYAEQDIAVDLPFSGAFALCTLHRAENTDNRERLQSIASALIAIGKHMNILLPVHPRTQKCFLEAGVSFSGSGVFCVPPVGYREMINLLKRCRVVLTDSGGLQKEAYFFEKPCVTLRDETEWVELLNTGVNQLAGADADAIVQAWKIMAVAEPDFSQKLYGEGNASEIIVQELVRKFG